MDMFRKRTPAWLAHRKGLSDTPKTPQRVKARHAMMMNQADLSFRKWIDECRKRKARKEVMIAKRQNPKKGAARRPKSKQRTLPFVRCP